eukprot:366119-Chlamydomonas_euryale.AAC.47
MPHRGLVAVGLRASVRCGPACMRACVRARAHARLRPHAHLEQRALQALLRRRPHLWDLRQQLLGGVAQRHRKRVWDR